MAIMIFSPVSNSSNHPLHEKNDSFIQEKKPVNSSSDPTTNLVSINFH